MLVPSLKDQCMIGTRWILCNKLDKEAKMVRNKARLVTQDKEGINFTETFALVANS